MGFLSDLFGVSDAKKAIKKASKKSIAAQEAGYGDVSAMYEPYRAAGGQAFSTLYDLAGLGGPQAADAAFDMFRASPGYDFRFNEGIRAIDNSGAASGDLFSGNTLKALTRYGQDVASNEYANWRNSIAGLADTGFAATGATAGARTGLANNLANIHTNTGANVANAHLAGGQLLAGGINTLANLGGMAMGGLPTFTTTMPGSPMPINQYAYGGNMMYGGRPW